ncbi:DUF5606 family protein [Larkinella humicola]|uniref:Uncharacterized protein n=1 Tax=Larkinella humicola TaxID=2607654 RepID=A0A5N1JGE2_9BACT|nr:DUF5606 domain-containing protein [Larkinella humicola]KAA9349700.1 hypothetical protein F0P93_19795 [Larkinella humicola]
MEALKEIANIAGKSGLYRIMKPSRTGVIVESLDEKKEKTMIGPTARVSVLKDISIYTDDEEQSKPLADVFLAIYEKYEDSLPITPKSASNAELAEFIGEVVPEYDRDRVHMSDVKKMIGWYTILRKNLPEVFEKKAEETTDVEATAEATPGEMPSATAETEEQKA